MFSRKEAIGLVLMLALHGINDITSDAPVSAYGVTEDLMAALRILGVTPEEYNDVATELQSRLGG